MTTIAKRTTIREAGVDLSRYHAADETRVRMRAEGHWYPTGHRTGGEMVYEWRPDRWQAVHVGRATSPWYSTRDAAELWIEQRGIKLGGAYWHTAHEAIR